MQFLSTFAAGELNPQEYSISQQQEEQVSDMAALRWYHPSFIQQLCVLAVFCKVPTSPCSLSWKGMEMHTPWVFLKLVFLLISTLPNLSYLFFFFSFPLHTLSLLANIFQHSFEVIDLENMKKKTKEQFTWQVQIPWQMQHINQAVKSNKPVTSHIKSPLSPSVWVSISYYFSVDCIIPFWRLKLLRR